MTPIKKVQEAQGHEAELTRPLYTISGDAVQAKADAKTLDAALGTACLSAVNRHLAAEEQAGAEEASWFTEMSSFFPALVGLLKVLEKENGKPLEEQTHGQHLRAAKGILGDAERDLSRIERTLVGWERARSDIVTGLAAAKKGQQKKADEAVKAGTAAAKKGHEALVKAEADLRVWAFKQGKLIESAKKQLQTRRNELRAIRGLLDAIPDTKGTPV